MRVSRDGWGNTQSHAGQAGRSNEALKNIKGLLENAILLDTEVHEHHDNNRPNETIAFDHKLYSLGVEDDGNVGLYKITVEDTFQSKSEPNDFRFHNLHYLASVEKIATIDGSSSPGNNREPYTTDKPIVTTVNTVADLVEVVKKFDSEYKNQAASKVVDAEGKPLVVYHGTNEDSYWGERYERCWVDHLARMTGWNLSNRGLNGREIPEETFLLPDDVRWFLVMLGTNDLLQGCSSKETAERMYGFLEPMPADKLLLISPPPLRRGEWVEADELILESARLAEAYRTLAAELHIAFADASLWNIPLCFDGVHFTEEGHRLFAVGLYRYIKENKLC